MKKIRGVDLIAAERLRQVDEEGYTNDHDAAWRLGQLARAAAAYAMPIRHRLMRTDYDSRTQRTFTVPYDWPWRPGDWNPTPEDRMGELIKAGALIAAELDRMLNNPGGGKLDV